MYELTVKGHFASAHSLRGYQGPCEGVHGHTWMVEVSLQSAHVNDIGLVVDFRDIKKKLHDFLAGLDHVNLNDLPAFKQANPSTENLAKHIYQELAKSCQPFKVVRVRVWESDTASVTYFE